MSIEIKAPTELRAVLAKMKASKEKGINMNVWDIEIKAVEDAIITIEAVRELKAPVR
jgi:hypothetical protein